ncbi:unnamed protein product [Phytomonas sp. EM1]|nr:unnamed protein product [Phytomonas sp. EM1]|eukprot:CCW60764.1 unnamed protein product [Phytomonas sp. isolate EM1]
MAVFGSFFIYQVSAHPYHIALELIFATVLVYIFLLHLKRRAAKSRDAAARSAIIPSPEEQERRLAEFHSKFFREGEPITSNVQVANFKGNYRVLARNGCHVKVEGGVFAEPTECLDLATHDYHSFSTEPSIVETARRTVAAYGVGSCGPRGFYGTIRPHLECEERLARFCGTDDASIYSFSYATIATLLSCFASRGDYIVCDRGVSSAVMEGCVLTRCNVTYFTHNDLESLERELQAVVAKDGHGKPHRRLVVTEGVFRNTGEICPLPGILALCDRYKFRIALEDSYGFGAIGKTGRGTPEHFGIPISKIDVYVGSMSTSLGTVGGFCAGEASMIDFQRLSATAYVFSASLPPYVTASTLAVLDLIDKDHSHTERLQENSKLIRRHLRKAQVDVNKIALVGDEDWVSPLIYLQVPDAYIQEVTREVVEGKLQQVVNTVAENKIIIFRHLYSTTEPTLNQPSLVIVSKSKATEDELTGAMNVIVRALESEFS